LLLSAGVRSGLHAVRQVVEGSGVLENIGQVGADVVLVPLDAAVLGRELCDLG